MTSAVITHDLEPHLAKLSVSTFQRLAEDSSGE